MTVPSGSCGSLRELPDALLDVIEAARRATLVTVDRSGETHAVPIGFALRGEEVVSAIDAKPKGKARLKRLRNIDERGRATVLFDRWDEDWSRLAWVMVSGPARVEAPGSATGELVARYPQYRQAMPEGEVIAVVPEKIRWWSSAPV